MNDDPYEEGAQAYRDGLPMNDCPYDTDTDEAVEWEGGWMHEEELTDD